MAEIEDIRDLSHPFLIKRKFDEFSREQEGGEIELSLGLSLNGRFGIDPTRPGNPPLVRSSSVSSFVFTAETEAELGRTCSMPAAWQRRKEVQSGRRLEAKRKRVEKMKGGRMGERHVSIGSQGSGSSSAGSGSELQYTIQVSSIPMERRSSGSDHSLRKQKEQKQTMTVEGTKLDKRSPKSTNHNAKEEMMKKMMDMPFVSTQGVGPSGKRIQGFLYRYRKGEEVRIVCVCHGSFLTPAEFVKHAGGDDVSHPLKHIVVNPSPLL